MLEDKEVVTKIIVYIESNVPTEEERALAESVGSKCFRSLLGVSDMSFIEKHKGAVAVDMKKLPKGAIPLEAGKAAPAVLAQAPALRPGLPIPPALTIPGVTAGG